MAIQVIEGTHDFGTGDPDILSQEITHEFTQIIEGKDGEGDITDVIGVGKKYTTRETRFGTVDDFTLGATIASGTIVNIQATKSNEDFSKVVMTAVTYPDAV